MSIESLETAESDAQPYVAPKKREFTTQILVTVRHARPLPDLAAQIAARAWSIDGVERAEGNEVQAAKAGPTALQQAARDLLAAFGGLRAPDYLIAEVQALDEALQAEVGS